MRKRILLVWGYYRKSWVEPFEELKETFEFVYLFYRNKGEEKISFTDEKKVYWDDYEDGDHILNDLNPDKIIFMSITSGLYIALNIAAKNRKTPTFILQHGLFTSYKDYRKRQLKVKNQLAQKETFTNDPRSSKSTLKFLIKTLKWYQFPVLFSFSYYLYLMRKENAFYASRKTKFSARIPNYYICFTYKNATIHFELDEPEEKQLLFIGNPEFDKVINMWGTVRASNEKFYLHIDQAFAGNTFGESLVSIEEMKIFFEKLNAFCLTKNARFYIKLHPENYKSRWLPEDPNIHYIRDTDDINYYLKNALGCFGFFSTLLIPVIYYSKVILFKLSDSDFQKDVESLGLTLLLDFHEFKQEDINFAFANRGDKNLKKYIENYFFKMDGKSIERLKAILIQ